MIRRSALQSKILALVWLLQICGCDAPQPPYREPANLIRGSNPTDWNIYVDSLATFADHGIRIEERSGVVAGQRAYHIIL